MLLCPEQKWKCYLDFKKKKKKNKPNCLCLYVPGILKWNKSLKMTSVIKNHITFFFVVAMFGSACFVKEFGNFCIKAECSVINCSLKQLGVVLPNEWEELSSFLLSHWILPITYLKYLRVPLASLKDKNELVSACCVSLMTFFIYLCPTLPVSYWI